MNYYPCDALNRLTDNDNQVTLRKILSVLFCRARRGGAWL